MEFRQRRPLILSPWPVFRELFCKIIFWASTKLRGEKTSKNSEKTCPNCVKINEKSMLFFNIVFFALWHRFGRLWGSKSAIQMAALGYPWEAWSDSLGAWGTILSPSWTPLSSIERFWTFLGLAGATLGSFLVRFVDDLGLICGPFQKKLERRAHQTRRQRSNQSNAAHTIDSIKHIQSFCQLVQTWAP